jgi:hypothetical protein
MMLMLTVAGRLFKQRRAGPFESRAKPRQSKQALPLQASVKRLIARFDVERSEAGMVQAIAAHEINYEKH